MVINELLAPAQPITWLPWAVQYFFLIGLAYGALWLGAFELWRKAPDPRLRLAYRLVPDDYRGGDAIQLIEGCS